VRGTFVSREDSSTMPLQLLMHVVRNNEASGVVHYDLILHDTTFGEAQQHPGTAQQRFVHDAPAAVYRQLEDQALEHMAEHFHAHNDYPKGTAHLAAQRLTADTVWETTLDTNNRRKKAQKALGTIGMVGGLAMLIVPGGSVVSAGLMVVTSTAGIASVALELEGRLATEVGPPKLDRRMLMDVLQVVAISLPFGTLGKTFAALKPIVRTNFLLCMAGLDLAQGFVITADAKAQIEIIDANTAVQLATAVTDEQRQHLHAERDRQVAEVIGGAVVSGAFLLVSLGHGIKNTIATTRAGASFKVREPVRELAKAGREQMEHALTTDTFEHEGGRVQLTPEERRFLEHEVAKPDRATSSHADNATVPPQDHPISAERTPAHGRATAGHAEAVPASDEAATPVHERDRPRAARA